MEQILQRPIFEFRKKQHFSAMLLRTDLFRTYKEDYILVYYIVNIIPYVQEKDEFYEKNQGSWKPQIYNFRLSVFHNKNYVDLFT